MTNYIDEVFECMFADDVASVAETVNNLQQHIRHIENFCDAIDMSLNVDKSKVMVFRNGSRFRTYEKWYHKNSMLDVVPCYKYLGVSFTWKLCWADMIETSFKSYCPYI